MRNSLKALAIVIVGVVCGVGLVLGYNAATERLVLEIPDAAVAAPGSSLVEPAFTSEKSEDIALSERLIIPKIGVDAHIKSVGLDSEGRMATPGNAVDVAWYSRAAKPGAVGTAVISGHLNTKYVEEAVFYDLDKLEIGDEIRVRAEGGREFVFQVVETKRLAHDADTSEVFGQLGTATKLNLITCAGDWVPEKEIYDERLVVFAERVI